MLPMSPNIPEGGPNPVGLVWFEMFPSEQGGADERYLVEVQEGIIAGAGNLIAFDTENDHAEVFNIIVPVTLDGSTRNITADEVTRVTEVIEDRLYGQA